MIATEIVPKLRNLGIAITNRCNLTCDFCSRTSSPVDKTELPVPEIENLIEDALKVSSSTLSVAITGGEPVLHSQFLQILDRISVYPINISLNSNGLLLKDSLVGKAIDRKVKSFTVSIEGPEDVYRILYGENGKKKFAALIDNLMHLKKNGAHFYLNLTITPRNIQFVNETVSIANEIGSKGISISRVYPIGRAIKNFNSLHVKWKEWLALIAKVSSQRVSNFRIIIEDNVLRQLWDQDYRNEIQQASSKGNIWGGYLSGVSYAQVLADGTVLPDPYLELSAGNILNDSFDNIWLNSSLLKSIRTRRYLKGACGVCEDKYICGGHRGRAYGLYGDYLQEDPFCPKSAFEKDSVCLT